MPKGLGGALKCNKGSVADAGACSRAKGVADRGALSSASTQPTHPKINEMERLGGAVSAKTNCPHKEASKARSKQLKRNWVAWRDL